MTARALRKLQDRFFDSCLSSSQTLDEIVEDLDVPPATIAGWLEDPNFRIRLHGLRKRLRLTREFQIQLGADRAAAQLTRVVSDTAGKSATPLQRAACVDLIRLARDSRARASAQNPSADALTKHRDLYHPAIPADEASALMAELDRRDASIRAVRATTQEPAPGDRSTTGQPPTA